MVQLKLLRLISYNWQKGLTHPRYLKIKWKGISNKTRKQKRHLPWSRKCMSPCSQFLDTPHQICMCWCRTRTGLCPGHQNLEDQSQRETSVSKCFSVQTWAPCRVVHNECLPLVMAPTALWWHNVLFKKDNATTHSCCQNDIIHV